MPNKNSTCSRVASNPPWSTTWQNITTQPVRRQGRNQPTPHTRATSISEGLRACVQGPPLAQAALFANHGNMAQANFMLHAVARWRASDAWNSNKSLLMPAADPHVSCRCACPKSLPFDHGPTRSRGIRRAEGLQGTPTSKTSRQFNTTASDGNATTGMFRLESLTRR
jgi:hypothetical protein